MALRFADRGRGAILLAVLWLASLPGTAATGDGPGALRAEERVERIEGGRSEAAARFQDRLRSATGGVPVAPEVPAQPASGSLLAPDPTASPAARAGAERTGGEPVGLGRNLRVNDDALPFADQRQPAVAFDAWRQEYLVAWTDFRDALGGLGRGSDIWGRRVGRNGVPVGPSFRISGAGAGGDDDLPAVAWNSRADEYLVVWRDGRLARSRGQGIYGQRVAGNGALLGVNFRISGGRGHLDQTEPSLAYDGLRDQYLVVWQDDRDVEGILTGSDIWAQRLDGGGRRLGHNFWVGGERGEPGDRAPEVVFNSESGEYLVVWTVTQPLEPFSAVLTQVLTADGARVGPAVPVRTGTTRRTVAAAYDVLADEYLLAWEDARVEDTRGGDVFGGRLTGTGVPFSDDLRVSAGGADDEVEPAIAFNRSAAAHLVVWRDTRRSAGEPFAQLLAAPSGERVGLNVRLSDADADSRRAAPAVAAAPAFGEFLVVWTDGRNRLVSGEDIYGQVLRAP